MKPQPTDPQLLDQMKKINERIYSLERKMDVLAGLLMPKAQEARPAPPKVSQPSPSVQSSSPITPMQYLSSQQNQNNHNHNNNRPKERMMYTTICADCKKECSVPFKPTGDRPIYCKECFARRRNPNAFKKPEEKPVVSQSPSAVVQSSKPSKAPAKGKKKVVAVKKAVAKKKTVVKKAKRK